jgi:hypothetical protein
MKDQNLSVVAAAENELLPVLSQEKLLINGSNPFDHFASDGFEDQNIEFFDLSEDLIGVELNCVMSEICSISIKDNERDFVKMYLQTSNGYKIVFAGQAKIVSTFKRVNRGSPVLAIITYLGKVKLEGTAKSMNDFSIKTKIIS